MFDRQAALTAGGYREEFPCSQDYDFFWRLSEHGRAENLAEPLYHYRFGGQLRAHRAAQKLAAARRAGAVERVAEAVALSELQEGDGARLQAELKQTDHLLLAGQYWRALRTYSKLAATHPKSALAWGKLVRWGIFAGCPPLREACFR
jgi:hypothetical protein